MGLISRIRSVLDPLGPPSRAAYPIVDDTALINGITYALTAGMQQTLGGKVEEINSDFPGLVARCYQGNAVVFAVEQVRVNLFTEARFQFQNMTGGRPGDFWGDRGRDNSSLAILERPWPGGTTGDLLKYMMLDADFAGTSFIARPGGLRGDRLMRLRPDWVTVALGSDDPDVQAGDVGSEFLGVVYHPGGRYSGRAPVVFNASRHEVAYFAPVGDPLRQLAGMPWMWPILSEVMGDQAMTEHKLRFHENGAVPSLVVTTNYTDLLKLREWISLFEQNHEGVANAYKSLYLGAAMDAKVLGSNMTIDFKAIQGAGETRIAAAAGVPPVVAGLSEGLSGSSLNSGNFAASMRRFADLTMSTAWRNACGSLEQIIPPPSGSRLWYDTRDIPALKDNVTDAAAVLTQNATALRTLVDGGFEPQSAIAAVNANDITRLKHTGKLSVQLQDPNKPEPKPEPPVVVSPPETKQLPANAGRSELLEYLTTLADRRAGEPDYLFTRYSPDQPRVPSGNPEGGQFGFAGGRPGLKYPRLVEAAREGGFSTTTHGDVPEGGYMVSPYPDAEEKYDAATMTRQDVHDYRDRHADELARPNHYLGGWRDGNTVYLDISVHADTASAAERYAIEHQQLAYFDLNTGQTVYVPKKAA